MPVPARRVSSSHGRRRRSHDALKMTQVSTCPKCKEPALPHRACTNCGTYRGRQVLSVAQATETLIEKSILAYDALPSKLFFHLVQVVLVQSLIMIV